MTVANFLFACFLSTWYNTTEHITVAVPTKKELQEIIFIIFVFFHVSFQFLWTVTEVFMEEANPE